MSLDGIIQSIVAKMNTVTDVGKVVAYQRWIITEKAFKDTFKATLTDTTTPIRAFIVDRSRMTDSRVAFPQTKERIHFISIKGYNSIDDDGSGKSQKAFQALIDSVCDSLRDLGKCNYSGADHALYCEMPQVVSCGDFFSFGSVVCHAVEISVSVHVSTKVTG